MPTVVCYGTFDGLDAGHEAHLMHAANQGTLICVLVEPDRSIVERLGQLPASGESERLELVRRHSAVRDARIVHPDRILEEALGLGAEIIVVPFSDRILKQALIDEAQTKNVLVTIMEGPPIKTSFDEPEAPEYPVDALPL